MSAKPSIWQQSEPSERHVKNVDAKASSSQVRYLTELDKALPRDVVYETYQRVTGEHFGARRPGDRYKALDRLTASDLILAYKAVRA